LAAEEEHWKNYKEKKSYKKLQYRTRPNQQKRGQESDPLNFHVRNRDKNKFGEEGQNPRRTPQKQNKKKIDKKNPF
jgi:hypothetical protein